MKDINIKIQGAQQTPGKMNSKGSALKHIIIKLSKAKAKERILKAVKEKRIITYKGSSIRLSVYFSSETLETRRQWTDIVKVIKEKNCQTKNFNLAKLSLQSGEEPSYS